MKIIVTHMRPDLDAVGAVWAIKRFLPGWEEAKVRFVPAGERWKSTGEQPSIAANVVEKFGEDEVVHVDTGLGPLDHHQTGDENTCAAKRAWEWVTQKSEVSLRPELRPRGSQPSPRAQAEGKSEVEAGDRLMGMICQIDHFKEVFWPDAASDRYDITVSRILDGLKLIERDDDKKIVEFGLICLDSLYHAFQNKVWAEEELEKKGIVFKTRFGKGIGVETLNDDVVHLSQRMGYVVAVRKDPRKGYVRIKARPEGDIDLTPVYDRLKKLDPQATWFLHISKRMLLNGTTKNPKMRPTKLSLAEIIGVLKDV